MELNLFQVPQFTRIVHNERLYVFQEGEKISHELAETLGLAKAGKKAKEAADDAVDFAKHTVAELDEAFGDLEGYPADGNKADKVAFAEAHAAAK